MQKLIESIPIVILLPIILIIPCSQVSASLFTVTANPLWTNTGIIMSATDTVTIANPQASWNWGEAPDDFDAGGDYRYYYKFDEWITDGRHGEMIGYIGNLTGDLNNSVRIIKQNDPGLFPIGTANQITISGVSGQLWLGFNDDYYTNDITDNLNTGSVNVTTSSVPLPPTFFLMISGLLALEARRRIRGG